MDGVKLNILILNRASLNGTGTEQKSMSSDSEGGASDIPSGYEEFMVAEGAFSASDGPYYVKR